MNYGRAIRIARAARNVSQHELASRVHVNASYVSLLESGRRRPGPDLVRAIARTLGVPPRLFALMAAEDHEVRGIRQREAALLARSLLQTLTPAGQ